MILSFCPFLTRIYLSNHALVEDLTNRFLVAVHLFSYRSQMTSKCGKNNKVAHKAIAECVTDVLYHILTSSVIYCWTDTRQHGIYLFYIVKRTIKLLQKNLFSVSKSLRINRKSALINTKKATWRNLLSIQNETNLLVPMRCKDGDLFRKITPRSNLTHGY